MSKPKAPDQLDFEQAFEELQALVRQLEHGELPLEDSLRLFERGQRLATRCSQLLDEAELRLRKLAPDESGGYLEEDFQPEAE
ncbi:MAG TPA: exodeoxyribonuclease VII small subunit [Anaerolineales bacterium]|nr:exodeoxyribonuclease VII small subunit [Anaerolineales bacterium]